MLTASPRRQTFGRDSTKRVHDTIMVFDGLFDLAEEHGYVIVTPRGYRWNTEYGSVDPARSGRLAEKDVMNVLEVVRNEFNIDEDRIHLFGHSKGGAIFGSEENRQKDRGDSHRS